MKNNISQFNKCSNCGACYNMCPKEAIHVKEESVFYTVCVDEEKCINCGKCIAVCPVNTQQNNQTLQKGYAGYVNNHDVLYSSSSGGLFHIIAEHILNKDGIVYGAAFSDDFHSVLFRNTDEVPLHRIQKSKYVESYIGETFQHIKNDIEIGRNVLFCGTPCQAAGLKRYIGKESEKLFVCDFSCGGLPSHKMYEEYLTWLEKNNNSKVNFVDFRPKNYGWQTHSIYTKFINNNVYTKLASLDPYYKAFFNSLSKRDYCYKCDFANNHYSDIILADFWLFRSLFDIDNNDKGLSLVLTNSKKGEELIKEISDNDNLYIKEIPLDKASYNIKSGHLSESIYSRHNEFLVSVNQLGFVQAVNKFIPCSIKKDWKQYIKQVIKKGKYEGSKKAGY